MSRLVSHSLLILRATPNTQITKRSSWLQAGLAGAGRGSAGAAPGGTAPPPSGHIPGWVAGAAELHAGANPSLPPASQRGSDLSLREKLEVRTMKFIHKV